MYGASTRAAGVAVPWCFVAALVSLAIASPPSLAGVGTPPLRLSCELSESDRHVSPVVRLEWNDVEDYDVLRIFRDDLEGPLVEYDAALGRVTGHVDAAVPAGERRYEIEVVWSGERGGRASCAVDVFGAPALTRCEAVEATDGSSADVVLEWRNEDDYDALEVTRNGLVLATLAADATGHTDVDVPEGPHVYGVTGIRQGSRARSRCTLEVLRVPDGGTVPRTVRARIDLGDPDVERGLVHVPLFLDGENDPLLCGAAGDERLGRRNRGDDDPTPDEGDTTIPDGFLYLQIGDPLLRAQSYLEVRVTLFDAPELAGTDLFLQHARGGRVEPRFGGEPGGGGSFTALEESPVFPLSGSGEWIEVPLPITEAALADAADDGLEDDRPAALGADLRIGVSGGARVCLDVVEVTGFIGETVPLFRRGDANDDGRVSLTDAIFKLEFLFRGASPPACLDAADFDDDGRLGIGGVVHLLMWLFNSGAPPPPPGALGCGPDTSFDGLRPQDCVSGICNGLDGLD